MKTVGGMGLVAQHFQGLSLALPPTSTLTFCSIYVLDLVPCSLYVDQLWVSVLLSIYCHEKFLC